MKNLIGDFVLPDILKNNSEASTGLDPEHGGKHSPELTLSKFSTTKTTEKVGDITRVYHIPNDLNPGEARDSAVIVKIGVAIPVSDPYTGEKTIHFPTDGYTLDAEDKRTLAPVVEYLKAHPDTNITIEGHTDTVGSDAYNDALSDRRSNNTRKYLVEELKAAGITDAANRVQIHAFGTGETNLITPTGDEQELQENRAARLNMQYETDKVASARNFEHLYPINNESPDKFHISSGISEQRKRSLESENQNYIIVEGHGSVLISSETTKNVDIHYDDATRENVGNIRFLIRDESGIKQANFRYDAEEGVVKAETKDAAGKVHCVGNIKLPAGVSPDSLEVGFIDKDGKVQQMQVNKPLELAAVQGLDQGKGSLRDVAAEMGIKSLPLGAGSIDFQDVGDVSRSAGIPAAPKSMEQTAATLG